MIGSELVPLNFTSAIKLLIHDGWNSERGFDQKQFSDSEEPLIS